MLQTTTRNLFSGLKSALFLPLYLRRDLPGMSRSFMMIAIAVMTCASLSYAEQAGEIDSNDSGDSHQRAELDQDGLFSSQPGLLDNKLDRILPGRPHETDVYFLGFAGNGDEPLFASEARFAEKRIAQRYATDGRSLVLASSADNVDSEPLADTHNLFQSISDVGAKMNVEDDVLFLFLTSHGWKEATVQVALGTLQLEQLRAADLRAALDAAEIEWRIIVVSACYSGSFIEPLKTGRTIIMTAASAQDVSNGCDPDGDLTYFGEAFFKDSFGSGDGLLDDFRKARSIIARREKREGLSLSRPHLYVGFEMEQKLKKLSETLQR